MRYPDRAGFKEAHTSAAAAAYIDQSGIGATIRERLIALFERGWTGTCYDACDALGVPHLSLRPRLSELHKAGKITKLQQRADGAYGVSVWVWGLANPQPDLFGGN